MIYAAELKIFNHYSTYNLFLYVYFRITFCSDLMGNRDIIGLKFVCVGDEFLAFNVLLRIKSEQKVIGN